jgi:hypothetical protein
LKNFGVLIATGLNLLFLIVLTMTKKVYQYAKGMGICAIVVVAIICTISITTPSNMAASTNFESKNNELFIPGNAIISL